MKYLNTIFNINLVLAFIVLIFISCSKDSDDPASSEITVTTSDFSITIDENPESSQIIGSVNGSTNEGAVSFSFTEQNPAGAFSIDAVSGELKVANGSLYDFETNPIISGIIRVSNGVVFKNAIVTISLNDVNENNIFDGNVILSTQAEVDEFGTHNYIGITGYLVIGNNFGTDYSNIANLSPIEALTFVGEEIVIAYNGELQNLTGLQNLSEIGSSLSIYENPGLNTLEELSGIREIHEDLSILWNSALTSFNGLHNITFVERSIIVQGTPIVTLTGLHNITSVGSLNISFNPNLENIDALSSVTEINQNLIFQQNPSLRNLDALQNVNSTVSQIRIIENEILSSLYGLRNIGASIYLGVADNTALTTLLGLESIKNINSQIYIERNANLLNLNGLNNLIEVGQQMVVWQNPNLSNFCSLQNLCRNGNLGSLHTETNAFNPTKQDIINGNCSL